VHNQIRGLSPHPGAWLEAGPEGKRERIKVLRSALAEGNGSPGDVLDDRLTIACGDGAVRLLVVQRAGKRPMEAAELLRGFAIPRGTRL
jgi:methionyl-tRNA formyltransferase